jgi:hypothetical protein
MRVIMFAAVAALVVGGCTDVVLREPNRIAIAVPSAYKIDTAKRRADHYCERQSDSKAHLVRTENMGRSDVAYFECR